MSLVSKTTFDPMKYIWDKVSKPGPDGKRYITYKNLVDLKYLYETGFVDTDKYTLQQWTDTFKPSLKPDGSYQISEQQWMAKRPYRYAGPVDAPFDPIAMREGAWDPDELKTLIDKRIAPSCTLQRSHFDKMLEEGRRMGRFVNGKFTINKPFKFGLKQLLDTYPSPRRLREKALADAAGKTTTSESSGVRSGVPVPVRSGFAQGPSKEQSMADKLSRLLMKK